MSKDWYDEEDSFYYEQETSCLACGELNFRESNIQGLCVECADESMAATKASWVEDDNY